MNEPKFKVGNKVKLKKKVIGYTSILDRPLTPSDILTISDIKTGDWENIYGFEEDKINIRAHWCNVERNFERATITNWRGVLE